MAFYEMFNAFFDPVLGPLLSLGPFLALFLMSFLISLMITLVYKWVTDQKLMKTIKDDLTRMQKEIKEHKDNPKRMMELQKEMMDKNFKYMSHSMKPTLFTFIPLIIIFGWLSANLAYAPIMPDTKVDVYAFFYDNNATSQASLVAPSGVILLSDNTSNVSVIYAGDKLLFNNPNLANARYGGFLDLKKDIYYAGWKIKATSGTHNLEIDVNGKPYFKDILVADNKYVNPLEKVDDGTVLGLAVDQKGQTVIDFAGVKIGWFWSYVIFSILFSMILRKVLKVY
ncbi:MAG: EMC3/TMCO1 family protein [Candidatus Woesearchaeota archaeon]|nr:EMC3/TMCO1 family protein [Candidatus Woesearchaeota archaeon]